MRFESTTEKCNRSMTTIFRKKMDDGATYRPPEDNGIPIMRLYGITVTIMMRKHAPDTDGLLAPFEEVMRNLYRGTVQIHKKISGGEWAIIDSIAKDGEQPVIPIYCRGNSPSRSQSSKPRQRIRSIYPTI
jgi:hypothetical protein